MRAKILKRSCQKPRGKCIELFWELLLHVVTSSLKYELPISEQLKII